MLIKLEIKMSKSPHGHKKTHYKYSNPARKPTKVAFILLLSQGAADSDQVLLPCLVYHISNFKTIAVHV